MLTVVFAAPSRPVRLLKSVANSCLCTVLHTSWCVGGMSAKQSWKNWLVSKWEFGAQSPSRLGLKVVTGHLRCHWNTSATWQIPPLRISPTSANASAMFLVRALLLHRRMAIAYWGCDVWLKDAGGAILSSNSEIGKVADAKLCNY